MFPHLFPHGFHAFPPLNVCLIDGYDDLLLPGHRLFAQLQVFASGEHFYRTNFHGCSTVVHRVTNHYNFQYSVQEMQKKLAQCTVYGHVTELLCVITELS